MAERLARSLGGRGVQYRRCGVRARLGLAVFATLVGAGREEGAGTALVGAQRVAPIGRLNYQRLRG